MRPAFIVDGVRSPIGAFGGSLSGVRADDLAAHVIRALVMRVPDFDCARITDVILGCANQAGEDNRNVARMAALLAGIPQEVPGETVNRLCASGMSAIAAAARGVQTGCGDVYLCGGVEQMTRAPYVLSKSEQPFARNVELFDTSIGWRFINPKMREKFGVDSMGETAENVAEHFRISRADQDAFAFRSQQKTAKALESKRFAVEIAAITIPQGKNPPKEFCVDEHPRPTTTLETLAKLKPAFRHDGHGSVTAGNSSGINDGACAAFIASEDGVRVLGKPPLARVVACVAVGVEPRLMGMGPVPATHAVLERAKLRLGDMAVIELNEAFAAQSLGCLRGLGLADDDARVNPNGGAIALGHPLGMSGARLVLTAAHELRMRKERYALCTMCVGVGQGMAMIIEAV